MLLYGCTISLPHCIDDTVAEVGMPLKTRLAIEGDQSVGRSPKRPVRRSIFRSPTHWPLSAWNFRSPACQHAIDELFSARLRLYLVQHVRTVRQQRRQEQQRAQWLRWKNQHHNHQHSLSASPCKSEA